MMYLGGYSPWQRNLLKPKEYLAIKVSDMDGSVLFKLFHHDKSMSKFIGGEYNNSYHYVSLDQNNFKLILDRKNGEYMFREENNYCGDYVMFGNNIKFSPNKATGKEKVSGTFYKDLETAKNAIEDAKSKRI